MFLRQSEPAAFFTCPGPEEAEAEIWVSVWKPSASEKGKPTGN